MPIDDSHVEKYLKQFRPVAAEELRLKRGANSARKGWLPLAAGSAAAILAGTLLTLHFRTVRRDGIQPISRGQQYYQPLTLRRANAALFSAPSIESALDQMVFPAQRHLPAAGTSAFAVLSREKQHYELN